MMPLFPSLLGFSLNYKEMGENKMMIIIIVIVMIIIFVGIIIVNTVSSSNFSSTRNIWSWLHCSSPFLLYIQHHF